MAAKKTQNARGSAAAKKASKSAGTKKVAHKTPAKKASATKASATKATSTKSTAKKAAAKSTAKKAAATPAAKESVAAAKKTARGARKSTPATKKSTSKKAAALRVRADESPWTPAELRAVREDLLEEQGRLTTELAGIESDIQQLMRDSGDGSGDDDADAGVKTSEREQEFTVARNSTAILEQGERALQAIEDGTYGVCESCGKPIGKLRMQAQPRATLCVTCKQEQERH